MVKCPTDIATGRSESLFRRDMQEHAVELAAALRNARVCVIGGAGSIGSATIASLLDFDLDTLVIVDQNENGLANLMRRVRAADGTPSVRHIDTQPLDFGSSLFVQYLSHQPPFDFVLNFAALKHVRTERDLFSSLALIDTNVVRQADLLVHLGTISPDCSYFSVSTDKAANPVSVMGATKRLMEHVMFGSTAAERIKGRMTTARFANVAYSNGSLLASFAQRLQDRVPLAAPVGIMRYFVSEAEAGELCLLSGVLGESGSIYVPKLNPEDHLLAMEDIGRRFLEANGYEADVFTLEEEADAKAALSDLARNGRWPLILTPANTAGEKPYEEFVGRDEHASLSAFHELYAVRYASQLSSDEIDASLATFRALLKSLPASAAGIDLLKAEIGALEPDFLSAHMASDQRLDDRI